MAEVIKSYLVSLSSSVDKASFDKFASTMKGAEQQVQSHIGGIVGNFLKFQVAGTTAFASVGFGLVAYIDKLAQADLKTQLLATQNMMSIQQYRSVSTALDVLGVSLNDVFFGTKELQERFHILIDDQKQLAGMLGPGYEKQQQQVRDVLFQLQRLEVKGQYFGMKLASDLLEKLGFGDGGIVLKLERLNDFVLTNMPRWSDEIVNHLVPALGEIWDILKKTGGVLIDASVDFDNFVGALSGDDSINTKTASFESFARSIEHVVFWLGEAIKLMLGLEQVGVHSVGAIWDLGKAFLEMPGKFGTGSKERMMADLNAAADQAVGAARGFEQIGSVVLPGSMGGDAFPSKGVVDPGVAGLMSFIRGSRSQNAQQIARDVSGMTGIPANLIYGQMGNETGGFKTFSGVNNYAGIKDPATDTFRSFQSIMDFEKAYADTLNSNRYVQNGIRSAVTADQFARSLQTPSGTYYGNGSESDYARNVDMYSKQFGVTIGSITVNSSPNLTPEQHAMAIKKGVSEAINAYSRAQSLAFNGAYL